MDNVDEFVKLCDVGDTLYKVYKDKMTKITITEVKQLPHFVYKDDKGTSYFNRTINRSCFKTIKEAEQALWRNQNIMEKRELLKEYERELNKKYGLEDHIIVR